MGRFDFHSIPSVTIIFGNFLEVSKPSVFVFGQWGLTLRKVKVVHISGLGKYVAQRNTVTRCRLTHTFNEKRTVSAWNFIVPTLLRVEELYTQMGFFVPWIFAARYIHRTELRLVSLESSSGVEYGIKKIFLIFVFYRELSRFKLLRKEEWIHVVFIHIFRNFCLNFRRFC